VFGGPGATVLPDPLWVPSDLFVVARICNLPYCRFVIGKRHERRGSKEAQQVRNCDTADYKSALREIEIGMVVYTFFNDSTLTMTSRQIRQSFLDFFKSKQHTIVPSSKIGRAH